MVSDSSGHEVTHADLDSYDPWDSVSAGDKVSICFSTPHSNISNFSSNLPSPDVCSSSFAPPSFALHFPGYTNDVLYTVTSWLITFPQIRAMLLPA